MFTFLTDALHAVHGAGLTPFMGFFAYVWVVWSTKAAVAARYRPCCRRGRAFRTSVIVPVYREPEGVFRRALASVRENEPGELIVVVDGGDPATVRIAREYGARVLAIPKAGKRAGIAAGFEAADPASEVIVVVDSDTIWEAGALREMLRPFADPRVGGVTPRQSIFDPHRNSIRRLANWIEDVRYSLTVPAQSVFGQVGCLAGRTIAYRRSAFEPAVAHLVSQTVLGIPQHIGDDRVLTNVLLRDGWRTVYQSTARVVTDAPATWRGFWRQQLRWGRSSQRETLLSLGWLWRRPAALAVFLTDVVTPFALYAVGAIGIAHAIRGDGWAPEVPLELQLAFALSGMLVSIGLRQLSHLRRFPADVSFLPVFVLQLTFVMVPIRILAFATMLHQDWATRRPALAGRPS